MKRRDFFRRAGVFISIFWAEPKIFAQGLSRLPIWSGFGLNGSPNEQRFSLLRDYVRQKFGKGFEDSSSLVWLSKLTSEKIKASSIATSLVGFKDSVSSGEVNIVGFAHDYDLAIPLDLNTGSQTANRLYVMFSGVVLLLNFDSSVGWRILSSFPFISRSEFSYSDKEKQNFQALKLEKLPKAFDEYANAFVKRLEVSKFNHSTSTNLFARVTKANIHADAATKLNAWKVDRLLSKELIGFEASSSISSMLDIPMLPYQDNDALSKRMAVKFSDSIRAQDVRSIPDPDLYFEITLRDIEKSVVHSSQKGITILKRRLFLRIKIFDAVNSAEPLINEVAQSDQHEDKIPLNDMTYDTPNRDLVFYDYLLYKTLDTFFLGIAKNDKNILASIDISHKEIEPAIQKVIQRSKSIRG